MGVDIQTYRAKIGTYRHSHGVNVVTQVVVINFSHGLKIVGSVLFIGILLIMAGVEQNPGPKISDIFIFPVAVAFAFATFGVLLRVTGFAFLQLKDICHLKTEINEDVKTIKVSGLPKTVTDEIILMFFENTNRQGGGKVSKVQFNEKERSAIVVFEEENAVRIVLEKQPIQILGCKVKVETINLALEMSKRTRQQLEEEIQVLNRQKTAVTEQLNDKISLLEEKNDNLTMKLASANAKYERLQCVCQADRSNIISLSSDLKKLEETCEKNEKVRKTLVNQIRDVERQKEAAINEVDELKAQLKLLEETRDEVRRLNQTLELSEKTRQQLEEEIQSLNRQKATVTEQFNNKISLLEEKNNTLSEKNDNLNTKLASAKVKYERLQCVSQADRSNIISLSSDLKKLEETCEKHEKVSKTLASQIRDVERQKEAAMNEVDELKVQLKLLEETRDDARHEASCQSEVESSSDILQKEEGVGDSVRCYFCGGGLRNWERGDVPMEEHAKWYPKCPHMLLVKGQAYVEKLGRGEKPDEHEPLVQAGVTEARPSCLESVAAQSCVELGYAIDMVQRAIDYFIEHNGNIDFKGKDLCEVLFKIECEEDQQVACVTDKIVDSKVTADQEEDQEEQTPEQNETLKQENQRLRENQMCKICLDKRADVIFLPCGHMVSCPQCAPALAKCPICRKPVNGQIKAFFAVTRALSQWV